MIIYLISGSLVLHLIPNIWLESKTISDPCLGPKNVVYQNLAPPIISRSRDSTVGSPNAQIVKRSIQR